MEDSCKSWNTILRSMKGGKSLDDVIRWKVIKKDSVLEMIVLNTRLGYSLFVRTFSRHDPPYPPSEQNNGSKFISPNTQPLGQSIAL